MPRQKPEARGAPPRPRLRRVAYEDARPRPLVVREDRVWALAGLCLTVGAAIGAAVGAGVATASDVPERKLVRGATRLLLTGDRHAEGLEPHLRRMAREDRVDFEYYVCRDKQIRHADIYHHEGLRRALDHGRPDLVLFAGGVDAITLLEESRLAGSATSARRLVEEPRGDQQRSATLVWAVPSNAPWFVARTLRRAGVGVAPAAPAELGPTGSPTVLGYASWAGSIWSWLA